METILGSFRVFVHFGFRLSRKVWELPHSPEIFFVEPGFPLQKREEFSDRPENKSILTQIRQLEKNFST
ncbi:hypothetical protein CH367_05930 [Leptospira barantonii]|uniref:Uncharacterized protein n=1 Tax=Leptospira barantonii TaxID=2023184 RepID=A0ABX4NM77_9LEPT|nr:hypothetical protein CH367_05930 [Leptospira barantonii]